MINAAPPTIRIAALPIPKGEWSDVQGFSLLFYFSILPYFFTFTAYYFPHLRGGIGAYNPNITPYATINPNKNP